MDIYGGGRQSTSVPAGSMPGTSATNASPAASNFSTTGFSNPSTSYGSALPAGTIGAVNAVNMDEYNQNIATPNMIDTYTASSPQQSGAVIPAAERDSRAMLEALEQQNAPQATPQGAQQTISSGFNLSGYSAPSGFNATNAPGVGYVGPTSMQDYTQNTSNLPSSYAAPQADPDVAAQQQSDAFEAMIAAQDAQLGLDPTSPGSPAQSAAAAQTAAQAAQDALSLSTDPETGLTGQSFAAQAAQAEAMQAAAAQSAYDAAIAAAQDEDDAEAEAATSSGVPGAGDPGTGDPGGGDPGGNDPGGDPGGNDPGGGQGGGDPGGGDPGGGDPGGGGGDPTKRGGRIVEHALKKVRRYAIGGGVDDDPLVQQALNATAPRDEATYGPDTTDYRSERAQATSDAVNAALAKSSAAMEDSSAQDRSYRSSILPISRDAQGNTRFDASAGILGSLYGAAQLPGDVYAGRVDPMSEKGFERAQELAQLAMTGGFGGASAKAGQAVLGSGPVRRTPKPTPVEQTSGIGWDQNRINKEINYSHYDDGRSKAMVAFVNPNDFLAATTPSAKAAKNIAKEAGALDLKQLSNESQSPFLKVENGKITNHEGRHRMAAMAAAGYDRVPVILDYGKGSNLSPSNLLSFKGQHLKSPSIEIQNAVPLNKQYADQISKIMQEKETHFERGGYAVDRALTLTRGR